MTAPALPRLRHGERLLLRDTESRLLRGLADAFVCVVSMFIGVAFNALVMGRAGGNGADGDLGVLVTIALTLSPIFLFMAMRPRTHVLLTDQRIFVGADPQDMDSAEYHQITGQRRWLATLFVRLRNGTTLAIGNMRTLYAIEAILHDRTPA